MTSYHNNHIEQLNRLLGRKGGSTEQTKPNIHTIQALQKSQANFNYSQTSNINNKVIDLNMLKDCKSVTYYLHLCKTTHLIWFNSHKEIGI